MLFRDISIRAGGNIYVRGGGQSLRTLWNPTDGAWNASANEYSTKLVKENFNKIEKDDIKKILKYY